MFTAGEGATRIDVRSVWFLLLYASDLLDVITGDERERLLRGQHDNDLLDALAEVLATRVEARVRGMLVRGYRQRARPLNRVRGRIDHLGTSRGRLMESGRVLCRYNEQTVDLPRYRYMLVTLRLAARRAGSPGVRRRCLTTAGLLEGSGVALIEPTDTELSKEQFGHFDAEDRTLLSLSRLVSDMCAPEHAPGTQELPRILQDERVLRRLFEDAVRGFYRHHLQPKGYSVAAERCSWPAQGNGDDLSLLPGLNADVVIRGKGTQTIVECKFAPIFTSHRGKPMLKPEFLRQLFAYATVFRGKYEGETRAVLLGALVDGSPGHDLEITIAEIPFAVYQVDLSQKPSEIRAALSAALGAELLEIM